MRRRCYSGPAATASAAGHRAGHQYQFLVERREGNDRSPRRFYVFARGTSRSLALAEAQRRYPNCEISEGQLIRYERKP